MNRTAKVVLIVGLTAIGLSSLFPPWIRTAEHGSVMLSAPGGRALLFYPSSKAAVRFNEGFRIDYARLGLEWMVIGVFTGIGWLVSGRPESA